MAKRPFAQPLRGLLQTLALLIVAGLLAIPVVAVALTDWGSSDPLWIALRIAALEAFTIVFLNIVLGSFRLFFNRLAKPRLVLSVHKFTGISGFSLAAAHGVSVLVFGVAGYDLGALWVGPSVLAVLAGIIAVALVRAPFKGTWRWIHRLNYAIFAAILAHGLILGTDLGSNTFLKVLAGIYAAVVLWGLVSRMVQSGGAAKKTRRRGASAP